MSWVELSGTACKVLVNAWCVADLFSSMLSRKQVKGLTSKHVASQAASSAEKGIHDSRRRQWQ